MGKVKKVLKYTKESVLEALKEIQNGMSIRNASKKFNIPKTTLLYKHNGKYSLDKKSGPGTVLTTEEEDKIEQWILQLAARGLFFIYIIYFAVLKTNKIY